VRRHLANGVAVTARTGNDEGACTFVLMRLAGRARRRRVITTQLPKAISGLRVQPIG
jgi:hypothetical protein